MPRAYLLLREWLSKIFPVQECITFFQLPKKLKQFQECLIGDV